MGILLAVIVVVMLLGFGFIQRVMWGNDMKFSGIIIAIVSGLYILGCIGIIGAIIKNI